MSETTEKSTSRGSLWKVIFAGSILTELVAAKVMGSKLSSDAVEKSIMKANAQSNLIVIVGNRINRGFDGADPDMELAVFRETPEWGQIHSDLVEKVKGAHKRHYRPTEISMDQQERLIVAADALYWLKTMPDTGECTEGDELNDHVIAGDRGSRFDPITRVVEDVLMDTFLEQNEN
jgi:hypothetical protein